MSKAEWLYSANEWHCNENGHWVPGTINFKK